ncbi:MAG: hypothetical protein DWQ38_09765 [Acidobacteria bacterium]|nr:MAG: hypothetical protein DWQ38_09765 [Acidobacteriota bacterium]
MVCLTVGLAAGVNAQKLTADQIIEKHLSAIGDQQSRSLVKNAVLVGDASVKFVTAKTAEAGGRIAIATEGRKSFIGMNFNSLDYPQESILFDGSDVRIGSVRANNRSVLGNFLQSNDKIVSESLFGGVLLQSWGPLFAGENKSRISLDGTKKIEGRETYAVSYSIKGAGGVKIKLYFDKESFRHVRTEYSAMFSAAIGRNPNESAGFSETRLRLTEDFTDFKAYSGVTLPMTHVVNYSASGQNGTIEIEWRFAYTEIGFNQQLAADTFGG